MTLRDLLDSPPTIAALLQAYGSGQLSLPDVFAPFHAAAAQPELYVAPHQVAWLSRTPAALLQAQLDALAGHSPATKPLYGIPFAVKDNIDVAGMPTTAACPAFAYTPQTTATAVQRLMDAGAILVGKTNLDQFATGLVGARSPYGIPSSTFDDSRVSGGSSSGSAVVVSLGEVAFALGTDTAGSGRVPAGFNNVVGVKPTPGTVPITGVVPACRSLDCVSVFALTVPDGARVMAIMEGDDPGAPRFHPKAQQPPRWPSQRTLRIGVPAQLQCFGDPSCADAFEAATRQWQQLHDTEDRPWAVELVPIDFTPFHDVARLLYEGPWVAERMVATQALLRSQPDAVHPVVRTIIEQADRHNAVSTFEALYALKTLEATTLPTWQQVDLLMVPTAPTHPTLASVAADPIGRNAQLGTYTNFVNLLGLSALALPFCQLDGGNPFGITLIAPGGADAALAHLGTCWQRQLPKLPLGHLLGQAQPADLQWPTPSPKAEPMLSLAVVGAHLQGMPLHWQLTERRAVLVQATHTAPRYQLYALPGTIPPKPGLARIAADAPPESGHAIAVEVYDVPASQVGSFLAMIPPPLGLGSVELADGQWVKGFICEPCGLQGAEDISHFGGWRAYLQHLSQGAPA